jgi:hypothetical protein
MRHGLFFQFIIHVDLWVNAEYILKVYLIRMLWENTILRMRKSTSFTNGYDENNSTKNIKLHFHTSSTYENFIGPKLKYRLFPLSDRPTKIAATKQILLPRSFDEMTKITNSNQSHMSQRKYKSENGRTRTSEYIRGGIRCI